MIFALILFSMEVFSGGEAQNGLDRALAASEQVTEEAIVCMEKETKAQLKSHIVEATPELIVDSALPSCKHFRKALIESASSLETGILPSGLEKMADNWLADLRKTYIEHVDAILAMPNISESRLRIISMKWTECVTKKAEGWSRLRDEASTVGQAAATSCASYKTYMRSASAYHFKSQKLSISPSRDITEELARNMKDIATEVVISERAKRLPKQ
jgi:hypothetical protein